MERYFEAHGGKTVFAGRLTGSAQHDPLFAGVTRMNYYRFLPTTWPLHGCGRPTATAAAFGQYWDSYSRPRSPSVTAS